MSTCVIAFSARDRSRHFDALGVYRQGKLALPIFLIAALNEFVPLLELGRAALKVLVVGVPNGEWHDLNLFRKRIRRREIAVALNQHATYNNHGIVRRGNLCHSPLHRSLPAGAADEEVDGINSCGAFADVSKISVFRRISELHAVIAPGEIRHMLNLRSFTEVQPAEDRGPHSNG
jgi:hypothetical protein